MKDTLICARCLLNRFVEIDLDVEEFDVPDIGYCWASKCPECDQRTPNTHWPTREEPYFGTTVIRKKDILYTLNSALERLESKISKFEEFKDKKGFDMFSDENLKHWTKLVMYYKELKKDYEKKYKK